VLHLLDDGGPGPAQRRGKELRNARSVERRQIGAAAKVG